MANYPPQLDASYLRKLFGRIDRPMSEGFVYRPKADYPQNYDNDSEKEIATYFRARGVGFRQPIRECMVWRTPKSTGKYRIIKKGYVGIKTPYHPDGRW